MKVRDMKEGDMFWIEGLWFPVVREGEMLKAIQNGWTGLLEWSADKEATLVPMPTTPKELVDFVREYQLREKD